MAFRTLIDLLEDHVRASFPKIDFIVGECWLNRSGQSAVSQVGSVGWPLGNVVALGHKNHLNIGFCHVVTPGQFIPFTSSCDFLKYWFGMWQVPSDTWVPFA